MDYNKLAELLFPNIDKTPEYYEEHFPKRVLPEGAKVTRLATFAYRLHTSWQPVRRIC